MLLYKSHLILSQFSLVYSEISSFRISSCDCICLDLSFVRRIHLNIVLVNFLVDLTMSLRREGFVLAHSLGALSLWCGGHSSRSRRQWVTLQGESGSRGKWTFPLLLVIQFQTWPHDTTPLTCVVDKRCLLLNLSRNILIETGVSVWWLRIQSRSQWRLIAPSAFSHAGYDSLSVLSILDNISSLILKDNCAGYNNLRWHLFSFSTWKILFHVIWPLASPKQCAITTMTLLFH